MYGFIRRAIGITVGVGALAASACTISDASEQKKPADTAAATAAPAPQGSQTSTMPASNGTPASSTPVDTTASGALASTTPGMNAPAAASGTASDSGAGGPKSGALAPDSVDVGRHKADSLPVAKMRLEVDLNARKLYVYEGDARVATQSVAVGSPEWPTQTGQWFVRQVIWNPEWIPPDESWAEQKQPRKPGAPDNPLGRAQLVYDPPRTIHGTNEPASIGKNVSHGSIRLANAVIVKLARQVMEETGAGKDDAWYARVQKNRTQKVVVDLPQRVPIKVF